MAINKVWDLVALSKESKGVGCKWVFKAKKDSKGNIERLEARLVAKGVNYNETYSPTSKKDSFRIIMEFVTWSLIKSM